MWTRALITRRGGCRNDFPKYPLYHLETEDQESGACLLKTRVKRTATSGKEK